MAANERPNRSVADCLSPEQIRDALLLTTGNLGNSEGNGVKLDHVDDWILPSYDADTTEAQSMEQELRRLQVLKSYLILDAEREEAFERITRIAAASFNVPISLVSLVDLGRQWFMSNRGLPTDVRETPRKFAFCAHAILQKPPTISSSVTDKESSVEFDSDKRDSDPVLIVPDATKDHRFLDNPLVTGAPHIRFYAGAPLISPEGYRLGTLCIISDKIRPEGLSYSEQCLLKDIAAMTVQLMVDRRSRIGFQQRDTAQMIASTAHELLTPLTGVQLSLSMLKDDEELVNFLGSARLELLDTAISCSDLLEAICQASVSDLRSQPADALLQELNRNPPDDQNQANVTMQNTLPRTQTRDLQKSIHMLVEPLPKKVPIIVSLESSVPEEVLADDLKLFKAALIILNHSASRTVRGSIHLNIFATRTIHITEQGASVQQKHDMLVFECEDTGNDVSEEEAKSLFEHPSDNDASQAGLWSLKSLVDGSKGEFGYRPRSVGRDGKPMVDTMGQPLTGAVFWFNIPLHIPTQLSQGDDSPSTSSTLFDENTVRTSSESTLADVKCDNGGVCISNTRVKSFGVVKVPSAEALRRSLSSGDFLRKLKVKVDNKAHADAINASCLGGVLDAEQSKLDVTTNNTKKRNRELHRREKSAPSLISSEFNDAGTASHNALWEFDSGHETNSKWPQQHIAPGKSAKILNPVLAKALADFNMHPTGKFFGTSPVESPLQLLKLNDANKQSGEKVGTSKLEYLQIIKDSTPPMVVKKKSDDGHTSNASNASISKTNLSSSRSRTKSALIIDDSVIILKTVSRAFTKLGYGVVVQATNGMEGLEELKKQMFDIVLCDFLMPVMDGFDCVKQFRVWEKANRSSFHQFIAGISAHATNNDGDQGIEAGMDDFRSKPVNIKTLTDLQESPLCVAGSRQLDATHESKTKVSERTGIENTTHSKTKTNNTYDKTIERNDEIMKEQASLNNLVTKQEGQPQFCLVATSSLDSTYTTAKSDFEATGWNVKVAHDSTEALTLLKSRNWDTVIVDELLLPISGTVCIDQFRLWEKDNRINGQRNIILICDGPIPSPRDTRSIVHPPIGCCAVIPRPLDVTDVKFIIDKNSGVDIIMRH